MYVRAEWAELTGYDLDLRRPEDVTSKIPGAVIIDAKSVYDAFYKGEGASAAFSLKEKYAALDLMAITENLRRQNTPLLWVASDAQLADGLTKAAAADALLHFLQRGQLWVVKYDPEFIAAKRKKAKGLSESALEISEPQSDLTHAAKVQYSLISGAGIVPSTGLEPRGQVAKQFSSAAGYLTEVSHVIWDIHEGDVLVKLDPPNIMLLDVFMRPDEMLGAKRSCTNEVWQKYRHLVKQGMADVSTLCPQSFAVEARSDCGLARASGFCAFVLGLLHFGVGFSTVPLNAAAPLSYGHAGGPPCPP
eukprot:s2970_g10.t1